MENQLRWTLLAALLLSAVSLSTCAFADLTKIHEEMTEEKLLEKFNDERDVPDSEVVPIVSQPNRARRNRPSVPPGHHMVTIEERDLYLEPEHHVLLGEDTPVYLAFGDKSYRHGIRYEKIENMWPVVKPVSLRSKRFTSSNDHIVIRKKRSDKSFSPDSYLAKSYWSNTSLPYLRPWSIVDTVYPEILVIVDYSTYLAHGENLQALCKYMAAFWNAVDLHFRTLQDPKVRLNIAGLIVATDDDGAPYMTKTRISNGFLALTRTHHEVAKYLYQEERFPKDKYDVAIAITNYKFCDPSWDGKTDCNPSHVGMSLIHSACRRDDILNGVTVMEDHNDFTRVLTAAHEIGHLLGSTHDKPYEGSFERCHEDFGFLMSPTSRNVAPNTFLWSDCSRIEITRFLREEAECLRNKPKVKRPIVKELPGELLRRGEQCWNFGELVACEDQRGDECRVLYCRESWNFATWLLWFWFEPKCVSTARPLEGSSCSGDGICLGGVCVH